MQMINDGDTLDRINSWASDTYSSAAPSLSSASAPASAPVQRQASTGLLASVAPTSSSTSTWAQPASTPQDPPAWVSPSLAALAAQQAASVAAAAAPAPAPTQATSTPTWTNPTPTPAPATPTKISADDLAVRTVDPAKETVAGQLNGIMAENSPLLQQARADGMRSAFDRGLGNSAMAASAGEDSLLHAALQIATPDAADYSKVNDYNTAATNQAVMYNADQANQFNLANQNIAASSALADKNNAAQSALADKNIQAQQIQQAAQLAQQMSIAQLQDQTARWQTDQQTANSRYNTDSSYKQQVDNQKLGVANNIIQNMDLSPDRKAAMLEQLGFGTMATYSTPGTGLAGAVYVIDSTAQDLNYGSNTGSAAGVNGGIPYSGASTGKMGSLMTSAATAARQMAR